MDQLQKQDLAYAKKKCAQEMPPEIRHESLTEFSGVRTICRLDRYAVILPLKTVLPEGRNNPATIPT